MVRPRSATPLSIGSNPIVTSNASWQKRCQEENPRFSRVFFVLRRFSRFFEIWILEKIKRCQSEFSSKGVEVNLYRAFLGEIFAFFHRKHLPIFRYFQKNSLLKNMSWKEKKKCHLLVLLPQKIFILRRWFWRGWGRRLRYFDVIYGIKTDRSFE